MRRWEGERLEGVGTLNPKGVEGMGTLNPEGVEGVGTLELLNPRFEGVGILNPKRVDKNPKGLIKTLKG